MSLEKPNLRKNETNMAQDFEDNDEFRNSVSSERNSFVSNEINTTASLIKQMEDAKKKSKSVLRKTFLYYNQIKLAKLQQNLAVGKLF